MTDFLDHLVTRTIGTAAIRPRLPARFERAAPSSTPDGAGVWPAEHDVARETEVSEPRRPPRPANQPAPVPSIPSNPTLPPPPPPVAPIEPGTASEFIRRPTPQAEVEPVPEQAASAVQRRQPPLSTPASVSEARHRRAAEDAPSQVAASPEASLVPPLEPVRIPAESKAVAANVGIVVRPQSRGSESPHKSPRASDQPVVTPAYRDVDEDPGLKTRETVPTIQITIGRIDVRAVSSTPAVRPRPATAQPALSLTEYLKRREGGTA